jgi:hypothetical protein
MSSALDGKMWKYDARTVKEAGRIRKAGWWFWYPFLFGIFFAILGVLFVGIGAVLPAGSVGMYIGAAAFFVIAAASFAVALYARRDIADSDDDEKEAALRGAVTQKDVDALRDGGLAGEATIEKFVYLGDTNGDRTLVELQLQVTGGLGGFRPVTHKEYVPLGLTDRLKAGVTLPVVCDAADPNKLALDWEAFAPGRS